MIRAGTSVILCLCQFNTIFVCPGTVSRKGWGDPGAEEVEGAEEAEEEIILFCTDWDETLIFRDSYGERNIALRAGVGCRV